MAFHKSSNWISCRIRENQTLLDDFICHCVCSFHFPFFFLVTHVYPPIIIIIMSSFFVCIFMHNKTRIEFCMVLLLLFHRSYFLTLFCCRCCCRFSCLDCFKFVFCLLLLIHFLLWVVSNFVICLLLLILFYKGKMFMCMDLKRCIAFCWLCRRRTQHIYIYIYIHKLVEKDVATCGLICFTSSNQSWFKINFLRKQLSTFWKNDCFRDQLTKKKYKL